MSYIRVGYSALLYRKGEKTPKGREGRVGRQGCICVYFRQGFQLFPVGRGRKRANASLGCISAGWAQLSCLSIYSPPPVQILEFANSAVNIEKITRFRHE